MEINDIINEMHEDYIAYGGFIRSIRLSGTGITNYLLGAGIADCSKVYKLAEENNIPEAEKIEIDYAYNCTIEFKGDNLQKFLIKVFPEHAEKLTDKISADGDYSISSIDFS